MLGWGEARRAELSKQRFNCRRNSLTPVDAASKKTVLPDRRLSYSRSQGAGSAVGCFLRGVKVSLWLRQTKWLGPHANVVVRLLSLRGWAVEISRFHVGLAGEKLQVVCQWVPYIKPVCQCRTSEVVVRRRVRVFVQASSSSIAQCPLGTSFDRCNVSLVFPGSTGKTRGLSRSRLPENPETWLFPLSHSSVGPTASPCSLTVAFSHPFQPSLRFLVFHPNPGSLFAHLLIRSVPE